jgi:hypothetical protein
MMPFFALMMLEGRMRNAVNELRKEYGIEGEELPEGFGEVFLTKKCGFNKFIVLENKTLADICRNDTSFEQDFAEYLRAFDPEIRQLLGIDRGKDERKYLDIDKYAAELKSKGILMQVVSKWSAIDLSDFDNSDITTLEEHIKRKWADISASTAVICWNSAAGKIRLWHWRLPVGIFSAAAGSVSGRWRGFTAMTSILLWRLPLLLQNLIKVSRRASLLMICRKIFKRFCWMAVLPKPAKCWIWNSVKILPSRLWGTALFMAAIWADLPENKKALRKINRSAFFMPVNLICRV